MNNLDVVKAWREWAAETDAGSGDTFPSETPDVDFWFAQNGEQANQHFHCFASTGDGSLLAIWSPEGGSFESGPVAFLGGEGAVQLIADDVPQALAIVARCGEELLDEVLEYGAEEDEPDEELEGWLKQTYDVDVPADVTKATAEAAKRHPGLEEFVAKLNGS